MSDLKKAEAVGAAAGNVPGRPANCANCGGMEFESGWVHHMGYGTFLRYEPLKKFFVSGLAGERVVSRRCLKCNQITFFCDGTPRFRFSLLGLLIAMTGIAIALAIIVAVLRSG